MNKYQIELTEQFKKEFKKLDKYTQKLLRSWINKNIENIENPRQKGKALVGNKLGLWRYRIGDYRLICKIEDEKLIILALAIAHRKNVYK